MKKLISFLLCITLLFSTAPLVKVSAAGSVSPDLTPGYVPGENDKNGDGYDDSNVYLSDIMLAISYESSDNALQSLKDRGFKLFDCDLYHTVTKNYYMYLGYKTTTDPKKAIRDIKWYNYTKAQYEKGNVPIAVMGGSDGSYVATKVHYDQETYFKINGQFGFNSDDEKGAELIWFLEEEFGSYTGALVLKTVLDFLIVGLIYAAIMDAMINADYYAVMYYGVNKNLGEPILADTFMLTDSSEEPGYDSMTDFLYEVPQDIRWARSRAGLDNDDYTDGYLHFKRAERLDKPTEPYEDTEYLKVLACCNSNESFQSYRDEGWTILEPCIGEEYIMTSFQPRQGYLLEYYLMYKTTHNPREAITDIRILDSGPEVANIGSVSYFKVFDNSGTGAIFFTRANESGTPIPASSLKIVKNTNPRTGSGEVYARDVFTGMVGVITTDYYKNSYTLTYKGVHYVEARGKYIAEVLLADGSSRKDALYKLASQGAEGFIDRGLDSDVYIGYITTDNPDDAVTNLWIKEMFLTENNVVSAKKCQRPYGIYLEDEVGYFAIDKPQSRIVKDGVMYATVGNCMNIVNPAREKKADYKSHEGERFDSVDFAQNYMRKWERFFLYSTRDPAAGDPITRITLEEKSVMNNGSCAVKTDDSYKRYAGVYITMNYSGQDEYPYISELCALSAKTDEEAINAIPSNGYAYYVDYEMNKGCDGEYCYVAYKRTKTKKKAITGVLILEDYTKDKYEQDGIVYRRAEGVDLNIGLEGGTTLLYYTRDAAAGEPITELTAGAYKISDKNGFATVCRQDGTPASCNYAENEDIYLMYKRLPSENKYYICNLALAASGDSRDAVTELYNQLGANASFDSYDLNNGAGGDYVYLGYTVSTDRSSAVTGLVAVHGGEHPSTMQYNGIEYKLVADADLNSGAGGDYIYLYYTKDSAAGEPIVDIKLSDLSMLNDGSEVVMRSDDFYPSDLNLDAGGDYIFLHYTRDRQLYEKYICNVHVVASGSMRKNLDELAAKGCEYYLDYDFNYDSGGDWVYVGYSRTNNPDEALRGLRAFSTGGEPQGFHDGESLFTMTDACDMNSDSGGAWIYLYETYDKTYGAPIIDIDAYSVAQENYSASLRELYDKRFSHLKSTKNEAFETDYNNALNLSCTWDVVYTNTGKPCEFNEGSGGADIYMYTARMPVKYQSADYITSIVGFDCFTARADEARLILRENGAASMLGTLSTGADSVMLLAGTTADTPNDAVRNIVMLRVPVGEALPESFVYEGALYYPVGGYSAIDGTRALKETVSVEVTQPVTNEPFTEVSNDAEPLTEPYIEPTTEAALEDMPVLTGEPPLELTTLSADESTTEAVTAFVSKPAPEVLTKPSEESTIEPETELVTEPEAKPDNSNEVEVLNYNEVTALMINRNSGAAGMYLYYSKDVKAGDPIAQLSFTSDSAPIDGEWKAAAAFDAKKQSADNLYAAYADTAFSPEVLLAGKANFGTEEAPLYLQLKRPAPYLASVFTDVSGRTVIFLCSALFLMCAAAATGIIVKRKKKKEVDANV